MKTKPRPALLRDARCAASLAALVLLALVLGQTFTAGAASAHPQDTKTTREVDVPGDTLWMDTGVELRAGDRILITADKTIRFADAPRENGPEGLPRGWRDLLRRFPLASANRGALLGRIGDAATARAFLAGPRLEMEATTPGRLFLGINLDGGAQVTGSFRVRVEILSRAPAAEAGAAEPVAEVVTDRPIPGADRALLDRIPRRVLAPDGTAGDMVNFLVIGPEQELRRALTQAGWVLVNRTTKDALIAGLLATLSKKAYVELPMSELLLFGRPQDFGFAQGEPIAVVAERHHFRLWRAPFDVEGQPLWVGAGTHDVGFDRDQRTGKITHRIDPEVDQERDFIGRTLAHTGQVARMSYVRPANPVERAQTAHGQAFQSDGRVLVLLLRGADRDRSQQFAEIFCSVLRHESPDAGAWGACGEYLEAAGRGEAKLAALSTSYRVLVVPGVFNNCASNAPAFEQGRRHLAEQHGVAAELLPVVNDSSEGNGRRIAEYIREQAKSDPRPYIVVGYSKGAPDAHAAVVQDAEAAKHVAAFVSVAGAVGGSAIADTLPAAAERWMGALKMGGCEGDLHAAMRSLRRDVRAAFFQAHPRLPVPTYSFAAVAEAGRVSRVLQETWRILSAFDARQDAQLLLPDQVVPGSIFLGAARADHFAVALPFDMVEDAQIRALADRNRYPRTALLEAIVRYVIQDLEREGARRPAAGPVKIWPALRGK
jgi:hypothetical protein